MANTVSRALLNTITSSSSFFRNPFFICASSALDYCFHSTRHAPTILNLKSPPTIRNFHGIYRFFGSSSGSNKINTKVNFSISDSDEDEDVQFDSKSIQEVEKRKPPPPYDPFSKKPVIEEPDDPKNLQEIFHKMRTDGLLNNAVKMFDALSKDGLTHEALQLFSEIKDNGSMPEIVAHTAVMEVYVNAGQIKEAQKVYIRMVASGVRPNAYTYSVLIKGLAADPKYLGDAKKYLLEMVNKGLRPNAETYTAVFEVFVRENKVEEATEFLAQMKSNGFVPNEN